MIDGVGVLSPCCFARILFPLSLVCSCLQCYIERDKAGLGKKMYPVYQLYLKEGDRFLLAGKKRPKQKTSNYLISRSAEDLNRDSESFMGKLRSNFVGTGAYYHVCACMC